MVKPFRNAVLAEQVVEQIRGMLDLGKVKPGERLPSERELARAFGVSRVGVRAGLHLLKAMGVVEVRGFGTYVSSSPPKLEREPLGLLASLQVFRCEEILIARRLLEVGLAGLAAQNATEDDLALMAEEVTEMYASLEDRSEYLLHDIRFHRALAFASRNPTLATLTDMVSAVLYDLRRASVDGVTDLRPSVEMHRKIYGAVRSGDIEGAKTAMSEHLSGAEHDIRTTNDASLTKRTKLPKRLTE